MRLRTAPFPIDGMEDRWVMFVIEYLKTRKASVAAEAVGYAPDTGYQLLKEPRIEEAISFALQKFYEEAKIDAQWVLKEAVDNHYLCRQMGDIKGSNAALNLIAKHASVDAFAAEKLLLSDDKERVAALMRGRKRAQETNDDDNNPAPPSFM